MNAWLLCVILDYQSDRVADRPICTTEPSEAACTLELIDWTKRATYWELRMNNRRHAFAMCSQEEVST